MLAAPAERRSDMALFAQQIAYTPLAWAALLREPGIFFAGRRLNRLME